MAFHAGARDGDYLALYSDLLSAALSEVNWDEIAGHWIDEVVDDHVSHSAVDGNPETKGDT